MNAEWRYYGSEDSKSRDPTRCGMPTNDLLPHSSLGSVISTKCNESYDMKLIRKFHSWNSMPYKERTLYSIFDMMTVDSHNSGISMKIIEQAKVLYKQVSETQISRGINRKALIASCIYMACKLDCVPRSTKEIAQIFNLNQSALNRGCKQFQNIMNMNMESTTSEDFIERFCSNLNIDREIRDLCRSVVINADISGVVSMNIPSSVVAGAIYLCSQVCGLNLSKKEIGPACGTSAVTLSKCYNKLYENRSILFSDSEIYKYSIK